MNIDWNSIQQFFYGIFQQLQTTQIVTLIKPQVVQKQIQFLIGKVQKHISPNIKNKIENTLGQFLIELGKELITITPEGENLDKEQQVKQVLQEYKIYTQQLDILFYLFTFNSSIFGNFIKLQTQIYGQSITQKKNVDIMEQTKKETGIILQSFKLGDLKEQQRQGNLKDYLQQQTTKTILKDVERYFEEQKQEIEQNIQQLQDQMKNLEKSNLNDKDKN